jgi:hypothetical protein
MRQGAFSFFEFEATTCMGGAKQQFIGSKINAKGIPE